VIDANTVIKLKVKLHFNKIIRSYRYMTVITSTECAAQSDAKFCQSTSHGKQKNLDNFL